MRSHCDSHHWHVSPVSLEDLWRDWHKLYLCSCFSEKPNHDFGGDSAPYRNWEKLYDGREINSPEINKVLTRDNCGKAIRVRMRTCSCTCYYVISKSYFYRKSMWEFGLWIKVILELHTDCTIICSRNFLLASVSFYNITDTVNDDKIDNFSCFITGSGPVGMPAPNKEEAKWSPDLTCDGLDQKAIK